MECQGKRVIEKNGTCPWVMQIFKSCENEDWTVKTINAYKQDLSKLAHLSFWQSITFNKFKGIHEFH